MATKAKKKTTPVRKRKWGPSRRARKEDTTPADTLDLASKLSHITAPDTSLEEAAEKIGEVIPPEKKEERQPTPPSEPPIIDHLPGPAFDFTLPDGCAYHPMGLALRNRLEWDEWEGMFNKLMQVQEVSPWWIGDCVLYAASIAKWGNRYKVWEKDCKLGYGTLRNYRSVCDKFGLSQRNDKLTFSHHAVVQSLKMEDAKDLLAQCADKGWSRGEFLKVVKDFKNPKKDKPEPDPKPDPEPTDEDEKPDPAYNAFVAFIDLVEMINKDNIVKDICDHVWNNRAELGEGGDFLSDILKKAKAMQDLIKGLKGVEQKIQEEKAFEKKGKKQHNQTGDSSALG
jgi:hypothetical protein